MRERAIQVAVREALGSVRGVAFWRNNVGVADFGEAKVRYGLAPGSSDLIGLIDGRFAALEIKTERGRPTEAQSRFLACVRRLGGFACVVRSADDALAAVVRCREGLSE